MNRMTKTRGRVPPPPWVLLVVVCGRGRGRVRRDRAVPRRRPHRDPGRRDVSPPLFFVSWCRPLSGTMPCPVASRTVCGFLRGRYRPYLRKCQTSSPCRTPRLSIETSRGRRLCPDDSHAPSAGTLSADPPGGIPGRPRGSRTDRAWGASEWWSRRVTRRHVRHRRTRNVASVPRTARRRRRMAPACVRIAFFQLIYLKKV